MVRVPARLPEEVFYLIVIQRCHHGWALNVLELWMQLDLLLVLIIVDVDVLTVAVDLELLALDVDVVRGRLLLSLRSLKLNLCHRLHDSLVLSTMLASSLLCAFNGVIEVDQVLFSLSRYESVESFLILLQWRNAGSIRKERWLWLLWMR